MARVAPEVHFWERVEKTPSCWLWTGPITSKGYGVMYLWRGYSGSIRAHRFAYQLLVGEIPDGMQLDHLCRNRACVNPDHLEVVTNRENVLRGKRAERRLVCHRGHRLDYSSGRGVCRECVNASARARRAAAGMRPKAHRSHGSEKELSRVEWQ